MCASENFSDLKVKVDDCVGLIELQRPPNNYLDETLIKSIADTFEALDNDDNCRSIVLTSAGKHFCAGAKFVTESGEANDVNAALIYKHAIRIFRITKPIVAAVQGAAIGAGLGLALTADFRVGCDESRFSANFTRLGIHPGFGLSVTLLRAIGVQQANLMLLTGRRIKGAQAEKMGLVDLLVPRVEVISAAAELAKEIADGAPLAVRSTRATMRIGLADRIALATDHELAEQTRLQLTDDYREGIQAMDARRIPEFRGR